MCELRHTSLVVQKMHRVSADYRHEYGRVPRDIRACTADSLLARCPHRGGAAGPAKADARRQPPCHVRTSRHFAAHSSEIDASIADRSRADWSEVQREVVTGQAAIYPLLLARQRAEHELITLHRERAIQRARAVERDPDAILRTGDEKKSRRSRRLEV
jgi:hypothetical protein